MGLVQGPLLLLGGRGRGLQAGNLLADVHQRRVFALSGLGVGLQPSDSTVAASRAPASRAASSERLAMRASRLSMASVK